MSIVQRPGFQDLVHDAQTTFRSLLTAMAHPGTPIPLTLEMTPPEELLTSCAAACLTLFDLDTKIWVSPDLPATVKSWLTFHAGCSFTEDSSQSHFAVIANAVTMPPLTGFHPGTNEEPEQSTTLLIQVPHWQEEPGLYLCGPGIVREQTMPQPEIADNFWQHWAENHHAYPLGVDVFFFHPQWVIGLPRTTTVQMM
jgi:alpha-D-ribose 1-methylphosphonate 5-triphosphate synthase subunit PhnH